jgi:hypothetical protein
MASTKPSLYRTYEFYVTLTEYTKGNRKNYYNRWKMENMYLTEKRFAADYDWALLADTNSLWFPETRIKPFGTTTSS